MAEVKMFRKQPNFLSPSQNFNGEDYVIVKCKGEWCKIKVEELVGWVKSIIYGVDIDLYFILDAQNLSKRKYHTAFAKGSTIASVNAIE